MSESGIPYIYVRGALVNGRAAYQLARVLDPEGIEDALEAQGFPTGWIARALDAVEAINQAGAAWDRDARKVVEEAKGRASARGSDAVPRGQAEQPSPVMETINTREAADQLGISASRVRQLARRGDLPATRDTGGDWQIDAAGVAERAAREE